MSKNHRTSAKTTIPNALARLGWHAEPKDVTASLANSGIEVSEGLVSRVRGRTQKNWARCNVARRS